MDRRRLSIDLEAVAIEAERALNEERRAFHEAPDRFRPADGECIEEVDPEKGDLGA